MVVQAVLLEGPPGTGKTHVVRIVSSQASIPLVYIPLESTASKWYGESEKKLSQMLNLAERMGGCIIFLDEVQTTYCFIQCSVCLSFRWECGAYHLERICYESIWTACRWTH